MLTHITAHVDIKFIYIYKYLQKITAHKNVSPTFTHKLTAHTHTKFIYKYLNKLTADNTFIYSTCIKRCLIRANVRGEGEKGRVDDKLYEGDSDEREGKYRYRDDKPG